VSDQAVLVTGGAGFIGSHLVDRLVSEGRRVRVLDALEPQVHGGSSGHRNADAEYLDGSVLDRDLLGSALDGADAVVHLAAQVGVGQSMYEMERYVRDNCVGTAVLMEELASRRDALSALVVASSMSIYGEGLYACDGCGIEDPDVVRTEEALKGRRWEPVCAHCGTPVRPLPTPERKRLRSDSVYATTKRDQEDLCLVAGRAYGIRTVALRFFNVYGPRQSLSNPYTGVAAIFSARLLNDGPPLIFEDGRQTRDFIDVHDLVRGCAMALTANEVNGRTVNLGTGRATSIVELAHTIAAGLGKEIEPEIVEQYRAGDIRHCFADTHLAEKLLGFRSEIAFENGMRDLLAWLEGQEAVDGVDSARDALVARGLAR
jgi:dTDP-L-rhamnose 4-epimerase